MHQTVCLVFVLSLTGAVKATPLDPQESAVGSLATHHRWPSSNSRALQGEQGMTCLGEGTSQLCCHNCTSCCKDQLGCNLGAENYGWGNLGSYNYGDFNFANNTKGDCNLEDEAYGIGSPEFSGCPKETWGHIEKFCAIFPYYHKCHHPPVYYGEPLNDLLREVVLRCDSNIVVKPKEKPLRVTQYKGRNKRSQLQRIRVSRDSP